MRIDSIDNDVNNSLGANHAHSVESNDNSLDCMSFMPEEIFLLIASHVDPRHISLVSKYWRRISKDLVETKKDYSRILAMKYNFVTAEGEIDHMKVSEKSYKIWLNKEFLEHKQNMTEKETDYQLSCFRSLINEEVGQGRTEDQIRVIIGSHVDKVCENLDAYRASEKELMNSAPSHVFFKLHQLAGNVDETLLPASLLTILNDRDGIENNFAHNKKAAMIIQDPLLFRHAMGVLKKNDLIGQIEHKATLLFCICGMGGEEQLNEFFSIEGILNDLRGETLGIALQQLVKRRQHSPTWNNEAKEKYNAETELILKKLKVFLSKEGIVPKLEPYGHASLGGVFGGFVEYGNEKLVQEILSNDLAVKQISRESDHGFGHAFRVSMGHRSKKLLNLLLSKKEVTDCVSNEGYDGWCSILWSSLTGGSPIDLEDFRTVFNYLKDNEKLDALPLTGQDSLETVYSIAKCKKAQEVVDSLLSHTKLRKK